jgi:hypothetical protein
MAVANHNNDQAEQCYRCSSDVDKEPLEMLMPVAGYEDAPITPLEITVESLIPFVPDIQRYAYVAKQRCKKLPMKTSYSNKKSKGIAVIRQYI